jgi:hypothetical protein
MAEAAAIALAAIVTDRLHLQHINFLSDNQHLVHFFNAEDQANLQTGGSNTFTQVFANHTRQGDRRVLKIQRSQNHTADNLSRQALSQSQSASHVSPCSLTDKPWLKVLLTDLL